MMHTFGFSVAGVEVLRSLPRRNDFSFQFLTLNFGPAKLIIHVLQLALKLLYGGTMGIFLLPYSQKWSGKSEHKGQKQDKGKSYLVNCSSNFFSLSISRTQSSTSLF